MIYDNPGNLKRPVSVVVAHCPSPPSSTQTALERRKDSSTFGKSKHSPLTGVLSAKQGETQTLHLILIPRMQDQPQQLITELYILLYLNSPLQFSLD